MIDQQQETDTIAWLLINEHSYDEEDACVAYFLGREGEELLEVWPNNNFDRSDFVNLYECIYATIDPVLRRSRRIPARMAGPVLQRLRLYVADGSPSGKGSTIEDPDDMKTAIVNVAMTYLGGMMLNDLQGEA